MSAGGILGGWSWEDYQCNESEHRKEISGNNGNCFVKKDTVASGMTWNWSLEWQCVAVTKSGIQNGNLSIKPCLPNLILHFINEGYWRYGPAQKCLDIHLQYVWNWTHAQFCCYQLSWMGSWRFITSRTGSSGSGNDDWNLWGICHRHVSALQTCKGTILVFFLTSNPEQGFVPLLGYLLLLLHWHLQME